MFELDEIVAGYGDRTVLRGVSLKVPAGRAVALLGPNGAGKTTLLRVASGLLRPVAGDVRLDGVSLVDKPAETFARHGICHIPEGRGIFRSMTVRDNLMLSAPPGHEDEAITKSVEEFPPLAKRLDQRAGTLSGGEQQMVAVSRAYLSNPSFVFLDEVSLGLAPVIVDRIFDFLGRIRDAGIALLLVEQYVVRVLRMVDFVFILNQGQIVFAGEPGELDQEEVFRGYLGADIRP